MRGLIYEKGGLQLAEDLAEPVPAPGEVAIRVERAGICATDLEISKGYMGFEGVLGHEFVGIVDAPDQPMWHGTRVVGGINCSCGSCPLCLDGLGRHCPNRSVLGILGRPGAFAETISLPLENLVAVPATVSMDDAVYAEPLAAVLRIAEQTTLAEDDEVAILGDGRLGLLAAGVGLALGWRITVVGKHPERAPLLLGEVPYLAPGQAPSAVFDVAIDCTGSSKGFPEALRLLKPQGKLVLKTTVASRAAVDLNLAVINEVTIIGSRCGSLRDSMAFLTSKRFSPAVLTSQSFPLSRGVEAFKAASDPNKIKVLLEIGS